MIFYTLSAVTQASEGVRITLVAREGKENAKKETLYLKEKSYQMLGAPKKGSILSEEDAAPFFLAHRRYAAVRRACSILSAADNSERMLYRKLRERGFGEDDARFALAYVRKKNLIRERDQLERLVVRLANEKLYGSARILQALSAKGYRTEEIRAVLENALQTGEIDFEKNLQALLSKKNPQDALSRKKLAYSYGYAVSNVD